MSKRILVDAAYPEETRIAVLENKKILEYDYELTAKPQIKGNIYLAKITRVEPSLQAAFIDYGGDKHGFLPFSEIHPSYYNVPASYKKNEEKINTENEELTKQFKEITPPDLSDVSEPKVAEVKKKRRSRKPKKIDGSEPVKTANLNIEDPEEIVSENITDILGENVEEEIDRIDSSDENNIRTMYQKYKIQEVIKKNQVILVQVIKEERGNKGASFTGYISLAGRYCVLMPNSDKQGGISRRVVDIEKRKRLKEIIEDLSVPDGVSIIIRTAGEDHSKAEIKRDYDYLVRLWNSIREHTIKSTAPTFIHAESDVIKRAIRDIFDDSTKEILISGETAYKAIVEFAKKIFPGGEQKVKLYKNKIPLFHKFGVEEQISSFYGQVSQLESGGYLVINPTEALTSIDVNSGRSTSERNVEETALKTNVEAAKEVARQLRLRDISGLVVIDFIDMVEYQNRRHVEKVLRDSIKGDRARIQVSHISPFGLVEMSRQRLRSSFSETNTVTCNHCNGKGRVRDPEANALMILRTIENEVSGGDVEEAIIYAHMDVVLYVLNYKREHIRYIEDKHSVRLQLQREVDISVDSYSVEVVPLGKKKKVEALSPTVDEEDIILDDINAYEKEEEFIDVVKKKDLASQDRANRNVKNNNQTNNKTNDESFNGRSTKYGKRPSNSYKKRRKPYENRRDDAPKPIKGDSWWKKLFS